MPTYFRFGVGPFRYSQRLGRTQAQKRADAKAREEAWQRRAARKKTWEIPCQVSEAGDGAVILTVLDVAALHAAVGSLSFREYQDFGTGGMGLRLETAKSFTAGEYVNVLVKRGKFQDIVPETPQQRTSREESEAFWAAMEEERREALETAKQTGWLLLDDGEVNAYHGVTPDGTQCHHRHRTEQASAECAQRRPT